MEDNKLLFIKAIANEAKNYLPAIVRRLLPQGYVRGNEYLAKNPRRNDSKEGSFSINLISGKWADFAIGETGGDIVSLYAYLLGINNFQAAIEIKKIIGG